MYIYYSVRELDYNVDVTRIRAYRRGAHTKVPVPIGIYIAIAIQMGGISSPLLPQKHNKHIKEIGEVLTQNVVCLVSTPLLRIFPCRPKTKKKVT